MAKKSKEEARELIKKAKLMRRNHKKIKEISRELGLSKSAAHVYSRGFRSHLSYTRYLKKYTKHYGEKISGILKELPSTGYRFEDPRFKNSSAILKMVEKNLDTEDVKKDLRISLDNCLDMTKSSIPKDSLRITYYSPSQYSIRSMDARSRAFLEPYTNIVLEREKI
jgi:signal recognition particle subunit SEC65